MSMTNTPQLLRRNTTTRANWTFSDHVAANIRYYMAYHQMPTKVMADALGISLGRARNIYRGRRPALVTEVFMLAAALGMDQLDFYREAH